VTERNASLLFICDVDSDYYDDQVAVEEERKVRYFRGSLFL
jgi:hypothetical protein